MIEGKIDIFLSYKEPDKNLLWLRPYLDKDGYELLYFGVNGWTPLKCGCSNFKVNSNNTIIQEDTLISIPNCSNTDSTQESPIKDTQSIPCKCNK